MKIDFSILWVDNNADYVHSLKPRLVTWMTDHGFSLKIYEHKNETGMLEDLKKEDIELILMDYKLPRKNGDQLIKEIRAKGFYQDIIFYSEGGIPNNVFKISPDGVFFVDRKDLKVRITDLFELKILRASDLATLRGWIVADAIVLESLLGKVLSKCFKEKEDLFRERILSVDGIFDFGKKHIVLSGILKDQIAVLIKNNPKSAVIPALQACKKILDVFPPEIIEIRNALAHQEAELSETGHKKIKTKTKESKEIIITLEECIKIRQNIGKHRENLLSLEVRV